MKIQRLFLSKEKFGMNLELCGIEHCQPGFMMRPHSRDFFLMHYVFEGSGILESHNAKHPFSAGDIFLIFPHDIVSYYSLQDDRLRFCWVGFSGENAARIIERAGFARKNPVCSLIDAGEIINIIRQCIELYDSNPQNIELLIQSNLYRIFAEIESCRIKQRIAAQHGSIAAEHVNIAKRYIEFNYMFPLSVGQIVRHVNLERTYFSRTFSRIEGMTIQEYLLRYRIRIAKRLLREAKYGVKEIGMLVGIPDPYYFSRVFKKITGMPPSQFR